MSRNKDKDDMRTQEDPIALDFATASTVGETMDVVDFKGTEKESFHANSRWFKKREAIQRHSEMIYAELYRRYEMTLSDNVEPQFQIVTASLEQQIWELLHKVNGLLLEEEQFFSYFYLQMEHRVHLTMKSAYSVNIKKGKYVLYVNPFILLLEPPDVMKDGIKREILHIISSHLTRAVILTEHFHPIAVHMAMDIVVNDYLDYVNRDALTVSSVNSRFGLELKRFRTIEYYAKALDSIVKEKTELFTLIAVAENAVAMDADLNGNHSLWSESDPLTTELIDQFTERYIKQAEKGDTAGYVKSLLTTFQKMRRTMPWYFYLKKLMGKIASGREKTTMRRNRRQPERLELSGSLRDHKANVWVALDMSGSITDEEFTHALEQVLQIVRDYNYKVTVVECDNEVRRTYTVCDIKDIQPRLDVRGATEFRPVIKLANKQRIDLLVYFTDGKGETQLRVKPKGYKILWVLTGPNPELSVTESYGIVRELGVAEADERVDIDEFLCITGRGGYSMANQEIVQ